jgi:hypothetical protein
MNGTFDWAKRWKETASEYYRSFWWAGPELVKSQGQLGVALRWARRWKAAAKRVRHVEAVTIQELGKSNTKFANEADWAWKAERAAVKEREQFRADLLGVQRDFDAVVAERDAKDRQVAALYAEAEALRRVVAALEAENARLREALEAILTSDSCWGGGYAWHQTLKEARAALAGTGGTKP